jgi:predicted GNAT family N-acyltransferase
VGILASAKPLSKIIAEFKPEGHHFLSIFALDDQIPLPTPLVIRRFTREESPLDFDLALHLRQEVFVLEQAVPFEEEQDEYDDEAIHWLILDMEALEILATARMTSYQEGCQMRPVAKIGRVAVKQSARGKGLGELLMREILDTVEEQGYDQAILDAQVQALPFYEKLGFVAEGDEFMDANIPHFRMRYVRS